MPLATHNKSPKTYIVIGCPGSGTSFIAKALQDQGVDMGCKNNDLFREDHGFVKLNTDIINLYGGGDDSLDILKMRDDYDIRPYILKKRTHKKVRELIDKKDKDFWGAKCPRFAFTLKEYLPYLEDDVYLVAIFRKPSQMFASPSKQWTHSEQSVKLINKWNNEIIKSIKLFLNNMPRKKVEKKVEKVEKVEKEPRVIKPKCPVEDKCRVCGKDLLLRQERCVCAWCAEFDEKAADLE